MELAWYEYLLIGGAGILCGVINTLAGSGSLITLPIFMFVCGLDATVANSTNRIGVIAQSITGSYLFSRNGKVDFQNLIWLVVPAATGAVLGSLIAVDMNEQMMNYAILGLMIFMLGVVLINPQRWLKPVITDTSRNKSTLSLFIFFLIGIYGGFIQAGVGIFLLTALVLIAGYDLIVANGIKMSLILALNIPAFFIFLLHGQVNWGFGLLMALGQMTGAWIGARFATRHPHARKWILYLLVLIMIVSIGKYLAGILQA